MDVKGTFRRRRMRAGIGTCLAIAALASLVLAALASGLGGQHDATQKITVTITKGVTTVTGAEALVAGPTKITAKNTGTTPSNFALGQLRPGKTLADLMAEAQKTAGVPEESLVLITSYFSLPPGQTFVTTVNLPAGNYAATQPPDGKGFGPLAPFTVAPGAAAGTPPATTGKLLLYDYGIKAPATIRGKGTLAIDNVGQNYHFLIGIRLKRGVNPNKVVADVLAGKQGPPPGQFINIIGLVGAGTVNYLETNLKPGNYVIVCFNADRHSAGTNHSRYGMVRKLKVK